ncbi:AraC family transcriptional regulator N-terminal domain-containing protein [Acidovorax sp.]|uniref:AraC family transcriptional regulator n=1 Tax=Acidovorax sp. TaxID=1872122 RepID=UPI00391CF4BD
MSDPLLTAVTQYARLHSNADGLATPPIPGLRMMYVDSPRGRLHSTYKPLVCLVLQGNKQLIVGKNEAVCSAGESIIVAADMPVIGQVTGASMTHPYVALAMEIDMGLVAEMSAALPGTASGRTSTGDTLFVQPTEASVADCGLRLMRLIDRPQAQQALLPGLRRELHYWLLAGPHGARLSDLAAPQGHAARLGRAVGFLRTNYSSRVSIEELAALAAMSLTAFHRHFKTLTSLSPGQYQKRLRLIEARRQMLYEGSSASDAAFKVGYESVSQFTREYGRMFGAPPGRDKRSAHMQVSQNRLNGIDNERKRA